MKLQADSEWWLYALRCRDGSIYCGITTDVSRRVRQHNEGKGSKYVRSRLPAELVFSLLIGPKSEALKAELKFKKLSKRAKEERVAEWHAAQDDVGD